MKPRTKITLAAGVGTLVIDWSLLLILAHLFGEGVRRILATEESVSIMDKSMMLTLLATVLSLSFFLYRIVSDYLRSKMYRALVSHSRERG